MTEETSLQIYKGRPQSALTPRNVLLVLFRRRKLITYSFVGLFLGVILALVLLPQTYEAESKILVEHARLDPVVSPDSQTVTSQQRLAPLTAEDVNSEVDLLQSEDLLRQVVVSLNLQNGLSWWRKDLPKPLQHVFWGDEETRIGYAVQSLQKNLTILPPNQSNLIKLTYDNSDPKMAAQVLDRLGALYVQKHLDVHRPAGTYQFFQKQVEQYKNALTGVQQQLIAFTKKENVVAADQEKTNTLDKLAGFDASLQTTQAAIAATEHRIEELQRLSAKSPVRRTTQVKTSAVFLEQLHSTLFTLKMRRTELLTKYAPTYRLVQDVDQEIAETQAALARAEQTPAMEQTTDSDPTTDWLATELAKSRSELAELRARATATQRIVADYRSRGRTLDEKGIAQQDLLRDVKIAQDNYVGAVRNAEEARISDQLDTNRILNVAIAEKPNVPALPTTSMIVKLALGLCLCLMMSTGLAFVSDYVDTSFHTPDEIEQVLSVPVLAAVPKHHQLHSAESRG